MAPSKQYTPTQRLQALALAEGGMKPAIAAERAGITGNAGHKIISRLRTKARQRGYNPEISTILKMEYVEDGPRSGRPKKINPEMVQSVLNAPKRDENGREIPTAIIGEEFNLSASTVQRILKNASVRLCE